MSPRTLSVADEDDLDGRGFSLRAFVLWLGALGVLTLAMLAVRDSLDKAHVALGYLLVVLGAGASTGRRGPPSACVSMSR